MNKLSCHPGPSGRCQRAHAGSTISRQLGIGVCFVLSRVSTWPLSFQLIMITCAAISADGSVVTWPKFLALGGDSTSVQDQPRNVQLRSTNCAFPANSADASVVAWGGSNWNGDSPANQHQLRNIQKICATDDAFAALLMTGTW